MEQFLHVCSLSLSMGLLTLVMLGLRRLLMRRYTARWRCWVWLVLALRLAVPLPLSVPAEKAPIQVELPRGVPGLTQRPSLVRPQEESPRGAATPSAGSPAQPAPAAGDRAAPPETGAGAAAGENSRSAASSALPVQRDVVRVLGWLWAAGAAVCLGLQLARYLLWRRAVLRWNRPVTDEALVRLLACEAKAAGLRAPPAAFYNAKAASPLVLGYVRPILLVPAQFAAELQAGAVLRHECIHIKRGDLWVKLLLLVAAVLNWFNPLAWLLRTVAQRDMELSCDEAVLAGQDKAQRIAYGYTLLDALEPGGKPGDFTA